MLVQKGGIQYPKEPIPGFSKREYIELINLDCLIVEMSELPYENGVAAWSEMRDIGHELLMMLMEHEYYRTLGEEQMYRYNRWWQAIHNLLQKIDVYMAINSEGFEKREEMLFNPPWRTKSKVVNS